MIVAASSPALGPAFEPSAARSRCRHWPGRNLARGDPAPPTQFRGPSALPAGPVTNIQRVCLARLRSRPGVHPLHGFARCLPCSRFPDCRAPGLSHLRGLSPGPAGFPSRAPVPHAVSSRLPGPRLQGPAGLESFTCPASIPSQRTGTCLRGVNLLEFSPRIRAPHASVILPSCGYPLDRPAA
jgi:hypothetical protein